MPKPKSVDPPKREIPPEEWCDACPHRSKAPFKKTRVAEKVRYIYLCKKFNIEVGESSVICSDRWRELEEEKRPPHGGNGAQWNQVPHYSGGQAQYHRF